MEVSGVNGKAAQDVKQEFEQEVLVPTIKLNASIFHKDIILLRHGIQIPYKRKRDTHDGIKKLFIIPPDMLF